MLIRCFVLGFHPCDTVQNRVDLKCCNSTRVACCEFICNRLHLSGTVLSLETVANIVILIQWCGEPGFDSDVLERGRYVLICSMISCPGETVRPSQKKKKRGQWHAQKCWLAHGGSLCFELLIMV